MTNMQNCQALNTLKTGNIIELV